MVQLGLSQCRLRSRASRIASSAPRSHRQERVWFQLPRGHDEMRVGGLLWGTLGALWLVGAHGVTGELEVIEHRVFPKDAYQEAKKIYANIYRRSPGCKVCSRQDLAYCSGRSVLDDHCCCDRRHRERFPFIPHTCYLKFLPMCTPVAGDCEKYTRLFNCCCQNLVSAQWRAYSLTSSASRRFTWLSWFTLALLVK